jgi:hypothetical protein
MELSNYGARVIGEEAAAAQEQAITKAADIYGHRVLGDSAEPAAETAAPPAPASVEQKQLEGPPRTACPHQATEVKTSYAVIDGVLTRVHTLVCQDCTEPVADPELVAIAEGAGDDNTMSVDEVKVALAENPYAFDDFMVAELLRKGDGPRLGALRHLREIEGQRDGGPREDVVKLIDEAIAKKLAK